MQTVKPRLSARRLVWAFFISVFLSVSGCAVYPRIAEEQNTSCHLVTKKLTLDVAFLEDFDPRVLEGLSGEEGLILIAGMALVAVGSAIISSSIMLAGNAVHWIEQEGTCEGGAIKTDIDNLARSLSSLGGHFAKSAEDISAWIKLNAE